MNWPLLATFPLYNRALTSKLTEKILLFPKSPQKLLEFKILLLKCFYISQ